MSTPYSEVDDMFLSDISDDTYLMLEIEEKDETLKMLRIKSATMFKCCKTDLADRDDTSMQYNGTLSDEEKLIIATIMRKYWLNDKIYNLSFIKAKNVNKRLEDDFTSGALE